MLLLPPLLLIGRALPGVGGAASAKCKQLRSSPLCLRSVPLDFSFLQCLSMGTGVESVLRLGSWRAQVLAVDLGWIGYVTSGDTRDP